jgi:hypothetical protein
MDNVQNYASYNELLSIYSNSLKVIMSDLRSHGCNCEHKCPLEYGALWFRENAVSPPLLA